MNEEKYIFGKYKPSQDGRSAGRDYMFCLDNLNAAFCSNPNSFDKRTESKQDSEIGLSRSSLTVEDDSSDSELTRHCYSQHDVFTDSNKNISNIENEAKISHEEHYRNKFKIQDVKGFQEIRDDCFKVAGWTLPINLINGLEEKRINWQGKGYNESLGVPTNIGVLGRGREECSDRNSPTNSKVMCERRSSLCGMGHGKLNTVKESRMVSGRRQLFSLDSSDSTCADILKSFGKTIKSNQDDGEGANGSFSFDIGESSVFSHSEFIKNDSSIHDTDLINDISNNENIHEDTECTSTSNSLDNEDSEDHPHKLVPSGDECFVFSDLILSENCNFFISDSVIYDSNSAKCISSTDYKNELPLKELINKGKHEICSAQCIKTQGEESKSFDYEEELRGPLNLNLMKQVSVDLLPRYDIMGKIDEVLAKSCGLIHGITCPERIDRQNLRQQISLRLHRKKMHEFTRCQKLATPVLLQRKNLILIGPPRSGKTLAYVMTVLSLLYDTEYYSRLRPGSGPRFIVLTSCAENVNKIHNFFMLCDDKLKIVTTHGGSCGMERMIDLTNGCDIHITTPPCFLRFLNYGYVTNLLRLCHIVFDDTDVISNKFYSEIKKIMNMIGMVLEKRKKYCDTGVQTIFVGEKWTPFIEEITFKVIDSPVVCFTSFLEAAFYARIKPKAHVIPSHKKLDILTELLLSDSHKLKTVIFCRSCDEVESLISNLTKIRSRILIAHEELSLSDICDLKERWLRYDCPLLICSDLVFLDLCVTDAQLLIHFTLPANKSSFSERFLAIKDHFYDRISCPDRPSFNCQVHIFIDETNEEQFTEVINILERFNMTIPEKLLKAVKNVYISKEQKKVTLCENFLMFGTCWNKHMCNGRHLFDKLRDCSTNVPIDGAVKVLILKVHNPSHYSVRILATKKCKGEKWKKFPTNYPLIAMRMGIYFSLRKNRIYPKSVELGDLVAVNVEHDLFYRAKINEIFVRDSERIPLKLLVYYIDEGYQDEISLFRLHLLPQELQDYPPESFDLFITGLQPTDCDNTWSLAAVHKIKKSISDLKFSEDCNNSFIAKVLIVAGRNLITTSFLYYQWLEYAKTYAVLFSPRKFILNSGLAELNNEHLTSLMNLALEAGLTISTPEILVEEENRINTNDKIQAAMLNEEHWNTVHVISFSSPSFFYLKLFEFEKILHNLEEELTISLTSKIINFEFLEPHMICAAKNSNVNRWNRAIITCLTNSSEVEVFFVDYGESLVVPLSDISLLPQGFVERLPFQAIECSLMGILPLGSDDWSPEALEFFNRMAFTDNNKLRALSAKVCYKQTSTFSTEHPHFKVILSYSNNAHHVCINNELVVGGYAHYDSGTYHLVQNIIFPNVNDETTDFQTNECVSTSKEKVETPEKACISDDHNKFVTDRLLPSSVCKEDSYSESNDFSTSLNDENIDFQMNGCSLTRNEMIETTKEEAYAPICDNLDIDDIENIVNIFPELKFQFQQKNINSLKHSDNIRPIEINNEANNHNELLIPGEDENPDLNSVEPILISCGILHPQVYWSQNDNDVTIKMNFSDLTKYQIDYCDLKLEFKGFHNEKYYWFDIKLFGPIHKQSCKYSSKGWYFEIKMKKIVQGVDWPRLTYEDLKHPWIHFDLSFVGEDDKKIECKLKQRELLYLLEQKHNWFLFDKLDEESSDEYESCSESGNDVKNYFDEHYFD